MRMPKTHSKNIVLIFVPTVIQVSSLSIYNYHDAELFLFSGLPVFGYHPFILRLYELNIF